MLRRLFPRLVLLLAGVLVVHTLVALALLLGATREQAMQHTLRSLETKIVAADVLLAQPDRVAGEQKLQALGLQHLDAAPASDEGAISSYQRDLAHELARRMPTRRMHLSATPEPMLWVAAERANDGWIGFPVLYLRGALRWSSAFVFASAVLLVFGAAAWYARMLVQPLRQLAAAAPGLAAGEAAPPLPRHAASEITELSGALDRAAADTRAAAQERQFMLAGLSHDMRTPLARLVLGLELVGGDEVTRAGMQADLRELEAILDQFIAYVRDGRDEPGATVDVGHLLDEVLAAQQRGGATWRRSGETSLLLYAKPLALLRALENLLENAQRHGAAPFEVELRKLDAGACIAVRDHGPGVAPETLHELGKPFYRADAARSGPGSGLGLATVMRVAAWHGGALTLRNRDGGGFEAELRLVTARV